MNNDHLEKKLRETELAYQSALEISQFKSEYLGKISHELRSPLSSMMGLHQLILGDLCDNQEEERKFVATAHEYAKKLIKIIDQVVEISQIESGRIELQLQTLQLIEILQEVEKRIYLQAANRNVKLKVPKIDSNLHIKADQKKLIQALVNLIDTTIHNAEGNKIVVSVTHSVSENLVTINIDVPTYPQITNHTNKSTNFTKEYFRKNPLPPPFSAETKIMLSKILLENMGGKFNITELPLSKGNKLISRLQCSLPFASPNVVTQ